MTVLQIRVGAETLYRCECGAIHEFMTTAILCELTHQGRTAGLAPGEPVRPPTTALVERGRPAGIGRPAAGAPRSTNAAEFPAAPPSPLPHGAAG